MYKIIIDPATKGVACVKRISDNAYIPLDLGNVDYQTYLAWVAEGNIPLPSDGV
jgi:hypothetical protein